MPPDQVPAGSNAWETLDRLVHEPARLVILVQLSFVEEADFVHLQRTTGLTKGNLSSHIARLEDAGYVRISKGFVGKVPRTVLALTANGREAFDRYRDQLGRMLSQRIDR